MANLSHDVRASYVVGCVPYVNGRPLVWAFEQPESELPVAVRYEVPSKLPERLENGTADAVLASSIEALQTPGRYFAAGLGITSEGPVESVRLFSKVPFHRIETLALDASSLTSNALARILLDELYSANPATSAWAPDLETMLAQGDACVLIGDVGMRTRGEGLHILDLGEAWTRHTGLPFVWALWIGSSRLTPELAHYLFEARSMTALGAAMGSRELEAGRHRRQLRDIAAVSNWTEQEVERYLTEAIGFDLGSRQLEGLRRFREMLMTHGYPVAEAFPAMVEPSPLRAEQFV